MVVRVKNPNERIVNIPDVMRGWLSIGHCIVPDKTILFAIGWAISCIGVTKSNNLFFLNLFLNFYN